MLRTVIPSPVARLLQSTHTGWGCGWLAPACRYGVFTPHHPSTTTPPSSTTPNSRPPLHLTIGVTRSFSNDSRWRGGGGGGGGSEGGHGRHRGGRKHGRNTQGSNEYRKKRALERMERFGHLVNPVDVPIQSVTDGDQPQSRWANASVGGHKHPLPHATIMPPKGIDLRFPSFGRKYVPESYRPIAANPEAVLGKQPTDEFDGDDDMGEDIRPDLHDLKPKKSKSKSKQRSTDSFDDSSLDPSSSSYIGGAYGRADAYRVPGQRYGGSYKNPDSYNNDSSNNDNDNDNDSKVSQAQAEEDRRLEQLWAQQDREAEERARKMADKKNKKEESATDDTPSHASESSTPSSTHTTRWPAARSTPPPPPLPPTDPEPVFRLRDLDEPTTHIPEEPTNFGSFDASSNQTPDTSSLSAAITDSDATAQSSTSFSSSADATPAPPSSTQSTSTSTTTFSSEKRPTWGTADSESSVNSSPAAPDATVPPVVISPVTGKPLRKGGRSGSHAYRAAVGHDPNVRGVSGTGEVTHYENFPRPRTRFGRGDDDDGPDHRHDFDAKRADTRPLNPHIPTPPTSLSSPPPPPPPTAAVCCGCGAAFQSAFQDAPGFLPHDQLDRYVKRRMALFEGRLEAERRKRELAAAQEEFKRMKQNNAEDDDDDASPVMDVSAESVTTQPIHTESTSETADSTEAASESSGASSSSASSSSSFPSSSSTRLHPIIYRSGKLDPDRPLGEQDLTLALNHGLIDGDSPESLLAQGISPDQIMTKRELNQLEREAKEQLRDQRGESALRCLRCFQLANYGYTRGQVTSVKAEDFRALLRSRFMEKGGRSCVILKVVDLFDFHGSFIRDFAQVVGGRNPVILVCNKLDLLPDGAGDNRLRAWIKAEAATYGLHFHSIELVSALTGQGLWDLVQAAKKLAEPDPLHDRPRRDIYIVGTTNVGKSSIVNRLIEKRIITSKGQFEATRIRVDELTKERQAEVAASSTAGKDDSIYLSSSNFLAPSASIEGASEALDLLHASFNVLGGKMTASIVPGTTLGMVSFPFVAQYDKETGRKKEGVQHVLYDTPGVINPEQISNILTYHELRDCMPKKQIQPLTYRITRGQCLILGGLARLDFIEGERDYCFFTVFASRNVTIHVTQIEKMDTVEGAIKKKNKTTLVDGVEVELDDSPSIPQPVSSTGEPLEIGYLEFIKKHGGTRIYPPFTPERCREIGLHTGTRVSFDLHGRGWLNSCEDIVFPGLGWISVTGSGEMTVRGILPGKTRPYAREPLMPFEARKTMKKWTGSAVRQH